VVHGTLKNLKLEPVQFPSQNSESLHGMPSFLSTRQDADSRYDGSNC
jgi:hypothetical protein